MNRIFSIVLSLGLLMSVSELSAQEQQRGWEIGPWVGVSYYLGDLNTSFNLNRPNLAGGLSARYNFNERLCFKFSGNFGHLEAYDSDSDNPFERSRNLSFESDIIDVTAQFEFNFLPYYHGNPDYFFTPYIFGGISVFAFDPMAELDGTTYELRPLGTEGQFKGEEYYSTTGAITYGFGIKFDISYEWSINIDIGARNTFTDYLDDVSTVYPDESDLIRSRGQIAFDLSDRSIPIDGVNIDREDRQRGDSSNKDKYIFAGIGVLYYFGDVRCPPISRR